MDIIGIGLDATEIDRIAQTIKRYGDRFLHRVFTELEIDYCQRKRTDLEDIKRFISPFLNENVHPETQLA